MEARFWFRNTLIGFKNLWTWKKIIWKDRDWDDTFLFEIIKFKISKMAESHGKVLPYQGFERNIEIMNTIVRLIDKFQSEEYLHEYFTYVDDEYTFEKIKGSDDYEIVYGDSANNNDVDLESAKGQDSGDNAEVVEKTGRKNATKS